MSTDPSPWSELYPFPDDDEPPETTAELMEIAQVEKEEAFREASSSLTLWNRFANRLRADGGIIR